MKKITILLIAIMFAMPAFADNEPSYDINAGANSANCVSDTLHATSGNVNLNANWSANTVRIDWYNDDTKLSTGQCTYDSTLTLPSTPSKTGYTFGGWRVRGNSLCNNVSCFDLTLSATAWYNKGYNSKRNREECDGWQQGVGRSSSCSDNVYSDLARYEWKMVFDYGTVKGTSLCSRYQSNGDFSNYPAGDPYSGTYTNNYSCWCKATEIDGVAQNLPWIDSYVYFDLDSCNEGCVDWCSRSDSSKYLSALYGRRQDITDCTTQTAKNTCDASFNTNDGKMCLWVQNACYNRTVSDCSVLDTNRCDYSISIGTRASNCVWSDTDNACFDPQVDSCEDIEDEFRCDGSYEDRYYTCQWVDDGEDGYCESYYDD